MNIKKEDNSNIFTQVLFSKYEMFKKATFQQATNSFAVHYGMNYVKITSVSEHFGMKITVIFKTLSIID